MNFFMKAAAAYFDRQWDDGVRSKPADDFGGMMSLSWGSDEKYSKKNKAAHSAFSSAEAAHWDHASTSWRGDRTLSMMAPRPEDTYDVEPDDHDLAPEEDRQ